MLAASAQSYSVIILVLLQLMSVQVIAGKKVKRNNDTVFVNVAGKSILLIY